MSVAWVAGSTRSRAMASRRLGVAATRRLAVAGSLPAALEALTHSPYARAAGAIRDGHTRRLADAQRAVAETLLWNLRVLAGWLPASGAERLRVLAGWFEIANVDELLKALAGQPAEPPYRLGTLTTAWARLATSGSVADVRARLAASPWGDPGDGGERDIALGMRLAWADRVGSRVPVARPWAAGGVALLVARQRYAAVPPQRIDPHAVRLLGTCWPAAGSLAEFAAQVPAEAGWALRDVADPVDLWAAELRWWRRLRHDGARLLAGRDPGGSPARPGSAPGPAVGFGMHRVVGAVALLAADAWLVRGALELAARGSGGAEEVFDALA